MLARAGQRSAGGDAAEGSVGARARRYDALAAAAVALARQETRSTSGCRIVRAGAERIPDLAGADPGQLHNRRPGLAELMQPDYRRSR